jgi:4-hydroxy-3-methylbut-2-enyl diphosphate reductase IspH
MEIVLAESLGFCMGVKRVVDMAYRAIEKADGQQVVTLGPLIHNAQEIERLEKDGVMVADEGALPAGSTVIIRAHGVTPLTCIIRSAKPSNCAKPVTPSSSRATEIIRKSVASSGTSMTMLT